MNTDWLLNCNPQINLAGQAAYVRLENWYDPRRLLYDNELLLFGPNSDCTIRFDRQSIHCPSHSWIIIPPNTWHICEGHIQHGGYRLWVHFDWTEQKRPENTQNKGPRMCYREEDRQESFFSLQPKTIPEQIAHGDIHDSGAIRLAHARCRRYAHLTGQKEQLLARSAFLDIVAHCFFSQTDETPLEHSADDSNNEDIRCILQDIALLPFSEAPSIRDTLTNTGQSYDHIARIFKQQCGLSPLLYINHLRMERAQQLMHNTTLSITEIAEELGFDDKTYFSRLFKKTTGITPSQFYREHNTSL